MSESMRISVLVEEERRNEQIEVQTLRGQMVQFRNEYVQYKAECERLQQGLHIAEEHLAA